ncbi:hypothetical protein PENTCL1PPCAC_15799, partial [Pristionchus entomophagus]
SKFPLDARPVESPLYPTSNADRNVIWLRIKPEFQGTLKPADGLSVVLFMSDFSMIRVAFEIYQKSNIRTNTSSLHHSVWIHESMPDPLGWFLVVSECETISHGRARIESRIFDESRKCVMSVVQEAYFQRLPDIKPKL